MATRTRARTGQAAPRKTVRKAAPRKAPSRKIRKSPVRPPVPAHRTYTPELLANGKRRFEHTDESLASIASDFGIHHFSLARLAKRLNWVRFERPPRGLPKASRLLAQAEALEAELRHPEARAQRASKGDGPCPPSFEGGPRPPPQDDGASEALMGGGEESAAPAIDVEAIGRLEREVAQSIKEVEAARAGLKGLPRRPREQEAAARTLASLTNTLQKLRLMRCGLSGTQAHDDYDDMPADIDAFRLDLARRIRAFVESRSEPGGDVRDDESPPDDAPRS